MQKKKNLIVIAICILSAVVLAGMVCCGWFGYLAMTNRYTVDVSFVQEREITVEYGTVYQPSLATAEFFGTNLHKQPQKVEVTVDSQVDTGRLGTYWVKYIARHKGCVGTAYQHVTVVDTQAPVITLQANPDHTTQVGQTYAEEGYTAVDNHDGDITAKVQKSSTKDEIIYTVADSSGNVATVRRKVVYSDTVAPVLKLNGKDCVTLWVGQTFEEPGYVAADNWDGNLTNHVRVSGDVDTSRSGIYTLRYSVADQYGNHTEKERKIVVISTATTQNPSVVVPSGKVIYLTFDDGPGPHTGRLLDVLKKYNVKATFFLVNKPKYKKYIKRASDEGHAIGIHTMTHTYKSIYKSPEAYDKDLYDMQAVIENITGEKTTLLRFPGGSSNTVSRKYCKGIMSYLTQEVEARGFQYFDWNVDSKDAGGAKSSVEVFNNVVSGVRKKNFSVVLQHDIKGFSVDAVENIILWGLDNGYTFLPLDPTSPGCHHHVNN